jgi:L-ascorbate metabolism protein UlaG (beta-lactamase superfamily)
MTLTYYGHSCFSVQISGKNILFDPFITPNELAKNINVNEIPADYIFISHGHFDHITDAITIAQRTGAKLVAGWEIYQWFNKQGLLNTHPLNPGGKWAFEFGMVKCVVAQHSNSLPDGMYGGAASGFVFYTEEGNFYYSGDTALTMDMQLISKGNKLDFAVLPIGDAVTMGVEDAIELATWLNTKDIVGVHYDTFGFIRIDHKKTMEKFNEANLRLHLVEIGETILLNGSAGSGNLQAVNQPDIRSHQVTV